MRLVPIPKEKYEEYRLTLMFDCYKWDPQFLDSNTIAKYALVITKEEHEELKKLTEQLDAETRMAEEFLNENQKLLKPLALPKKVSKEIMNMKNYEPDKHVRLMRYDFHPTKEGKWAVSEVNSDDRQVMQFLGDRLSQKGFQVIYAAGMAYGYKTKAFSIDLG